MIGNHLFANDYYYFSSQLILSIISIIGSALRIFFNILIYKY